MTTAIDRDLDHLLTALAKDGEDALLKCAIADLYESIGDLAHAECMRWAAARSCKPYQQSDQSDGFTWRSTPDATMHGKDFDYGSYLPDALFDAVVGEIQAGVMAFKHFDTPRQAWLALLDAWVVATAAGWEPEGGL